MLKKIEKYSLRKVVCNMYLVIFFFTMINREFLFLNLDLRYINIFLGVVLLFYSLKNKSYKKDFAEYENNKDYWIIVLYVWLLISNISWLWNGLKIDIENIAKENILLFNNLLAIVNINLNKKIISIEFVRKVIIVSGLILFFSILLFQFGFTAEQIGANVNENYIYSSNTHYNLYGGKHRIGGYAQDPNYATLFLVLSIVTIIQIKSKKIYKCIGILLFVLGIGFTFSKNIIISTCLALLYMAVIKIIKKDELIIKFNKILIVSMVLCSFIPIFFGLFEKVMPMTMITRFSMWNSAYDLFCKNIIIGNGITSFRTFYALEHWYVHAHNTYWQLLSETGILGLILFVKVLYDSMKKSQKSNKFIVLIYMFFCLTNETIALQVTVYILMIVSLDNGQKIKNNSTSKKALFMINSLSNGGAERVTVNMADELVEQGYEVHFILMKYDRAATEQYQISKKVKIYNLNIDKKNRIIKMLFAFSKINKIINENEKNGKYNLITSHLPMSNILTRFSVIRNRAIYVLHTTMKLYDKKYHYLFKKGVKFIYGKRKIVAVSKGLAAELIEEYGLETQNVKVIYNPINIKRIEELSNEKIDINEKYFLCVGRLSNEKRQDRCIEIFYKGGFFKNYKLVFCGVGPNEQVLRENVKKKGIQDKVIFMGWQNNIYKWMKNAEILLLTSDLEAFPMNLIEAMSVGTKIVSADCDFGPNEILIDEYQKYLVETQNIEKYIHTINLALKDYPEKPNTVLMECYPESVIKKYIEFMR